MKHMFREVNPGWVYLCAAIAIAVVFVPVFRAMEGQVEDVSRFPDMTFEEIHSGIVDLGQKIREEPTSSPDEYWRLLYEINMLEGAARKLSTKDSMPAGKTLPAGQALAAGQLQVGPIRFLQNDLYTKYTKAFGAGKMAESREPYLAIHPEQDTSAHLASTSYAMGPVWFLAYLWTLPLMGIVFILRLKQKGFSLILEAVQGWKPALAIAAWPVAMWKYPTNDPAKQLVGALRFACYAIATMLSLGGAGGVLKAAEKKSGKDGSSKEYTLVLDAEAGETVEDDPENIRIDKPGELIPTFDVGGLHVATKGWMSAFGDSSDEETVSLGNIHTQHTLTSPGHWGAYAEFEFSDLSSESNWVQQFYGTYDVSDDLHLRFGRVFLASPYTMLPPFLLETVAYPRNPYPIFAYGVQVDLTFGDSWRMIADMTGSSGLAFDDPDQFDELEGNLRLTKGFEDLKFGFASHMAHNERSGSVDVDWTPRDGLELRALAYIAHREQDDRGVYGIMSWQAMPGLELHGKVDWQQRCQDACESDLLVTGGVRVKAPNDRVSFTLDYERVVGGDADDRLLGRFQVRF